MAPLDAEEYERWIGQSEHTYLSAMRDCEAGRPGAKCAVEDRLRAWQELMEEARAYAERIREALADADAEVFLFGSAARGDFNLGSDLDLLVVSAHLPGDPIERSRLLLRFARGREEPRGLTPDEFRRLAAKGALWYLQGAVRL